MSFVQLLERNRAFLAGRQPTPLPAAGSIPHLILACYDPRLDSLLRAAFGLDREDAFLVRSAGAGVMPAGDPLRSIALAVYLFDVESITVVGHTSCRMAAFDTARFIDAFRARGVRRDAFGADDLRAWAGAIPDPKRGVQASVAVLRAAASLPRDLEIGGLVLDDTTGALEVIVRPDEALPGAAAAGAVLPGDHAERESSAAQETREAHEEPEKRQAPKEPRRVTASAGAPTAPDIAKLLSSAGSLVQALEAQAAWRHEVRRLRSELHAERNPLARVRLIEAFVRKAVAESREVAAALDRLKREAQGAHVPLDESLLIELVRRALMGEKP